MHARRSAFFAGGRMVIVIVHPWVSVYSPYIGAVPTWYGNHRTLAAAILRTGKEHDTLASAAAVPH